jgi:LysM repeat protein
LAACERPDPQVTVLNDSSSVATVMPVATVPPSFSSIGLAAPAPSAPPPTPLPSYIGDHTPDAPHTAVNSGGEIIHSVNSGETLGYIAQLYGVTLEEIMTLNELASADFLQVGQELRIPGQETLVGPTFKLIPDSELLFGPAALGFHTRSWAAPFNGFLLRYEESVEGQRLQGPEIVELVAHRHSVNPRLLLALLEYRSGWITQPTPAQTENPFGLPEPAQPGLYAQLSWAANELNLGFYGRAEANQQHTTLDDSTRIAFDPTINDGTAGVQRLLGLLPGTTYDAWQTAVGPDGWFAVYGRLFGNPFAYTVDPLWPADLQQPPMQLPWQTGETWYYTSGPHGGWNSGSAWAALDFAPDGDELGCFESDAWVTAMSDGTVVRSGFGAVVVDMDDDRYPGTGWAITYMHLATADRIPVGTPVQTGDRLGHPSCEGGFSNGTHLHIARSYNGRWVSADGSIPFNMGGWVSQGLGVEYDGLLIRGSVTKEACACREEGNAIPNEP